MCNVQMPIFDIINRVNVISGLSTAAVAFSSILPAFYSCVVWRTSGIMNLGSRFQALSLVEHGGCFRALDSAIVSLPMKSHRSPAHQKMPSFSFYNPPKQEGPKFQPRWDETPGITSHFWGITAGFIPPRWFKSEGYVAFRARVCLASSVLSHLKCFSCFLSVLFLPQVLIWM